LTLITDFDRSPSLGRTCI